MTRTEYCGMASPCCWELSRGILPQVNESSRRTRTDSCNNLFGSGSTRQSPPRETIPLLFICFFKDIKKEQTKALVMSISIKGKVSWPSEDYNLEMDTAHKGFIMQNRIQCQWAASFLFSFLKVAVPLILLRIVLRINLWLQQNNAIKLCRESFILLPHIQWKEIIYRKNYGQ